MRHLVTILIALFIGAYSNCNAQSRAEKKAQKIAVVKEKLDSGNFRIDITHIMPATQPMTTAHTTYYLEFQKDTFSCHLPYIGTSTSAIYGAQDLLIRSEKQKLSGLEKGYDAKQEYTGYIFEFINTNLNERWKCSVVVYDTGESKIRMDNPTKQSIAYQGDIYIERAPKDKKEKSK